MVAVGWACLCAGCQRPSASPGVDGRVTRPAPGEEADETPFSEDAPMTIQTDRPPKRHGGHGG